MRRSARTRPAWPYGAAGTPAGIFSMWRMRDLREIYLAMYYARHLTHGTDGHNRLLIIDKLARACGFALADQRLLYTIGENGGGIPIDIPAGTAWPSLELPE